MKLNLYILLFLISIFSKSFAYAEALCPNILSGTYAHNAWSIRVDQETDPSQGLFNLIEDGRPENLEGPALGQINANSENTPPAFCAISENGIETLTLVKILPSSSGLFGIETDTLSFAQETNRDNTIKFIFSYNPIDQVLWLTVETHLGTPLLGPPIFETSFYDFHKIQDHVESPALVAPSASAEKGIVSPTSSPNESDNEDSYEPSKQKRRKRSGRRPKYDHLDPEQIRDLHNDKEKKRRANQKKLIENFRKKLNLSHVEPRLTNVEVLEKVATHFKETENEIASLRKALQKKEQEIAKLKRNLK